MVFTTSQKNLGIIFAVSGIVQSVVWAILSIVCIAMHYSPPDMHAPTTYGTTLNSLIFLFFIHDNGLSRAVIRPADFLVFMFFYLFLSVAWCATSIGLICELTHFKEKERLYMIGNGTVTIIVSIVDIIFWGLLLRQYVECGDAPLVAIVVEASCYVPVGIVMTLSIRGYLLWILNVVASYLMIWFSIKTLVNRDHWSERHVQSIPRAKLQDDLSTKKGDSPVFAEDMPSIDRKMDRSNSPIFSDSDMPTFLDMPKRQTAPEQPMDDPYRNPSSFLNRGYERDRAANQMKSFGDRGSRFGY